MSSGKSRLGLTEKQLKAKEYALRKVYNINLEEFIGILDAQGWKCPVCEMEYTPGKLWAVDHEHRSGLSGPVRGVCCFRCNRYKIGKLTLAESERIYRYLSDPPAAGVLGGERVAEGRPPRRRRRSNRSNAKGTGSLRRTRKIT